MLEIRKGKSTKSYENIFFRKIATRLSKLFEERNWDGILLGMPECRKNESLQIDCLLVTEQQIIIIDLKNYSGTVQLPDETQFSTGRWMLNNEFTVKGGSAPNPFAQLGRQRTKLIRELTRKIKSFDRSSISTIVCFHDHIELMGSIPKQYELGFSIMDASNYHYRIADIIDVIKGEGKNYLSNSNKQVFLNTLFTTSPYKFNEVEEITAEAKDLKIPSVNEKYKQQINNFLTSDSRVMMITGNTKSGKTALISAIREHAFEHRFTDVPVLAYSNRIRKKMLELHPHLEEVESLFGTVFDFTLESVDENYKKNIPLRKCNDEETIEKTLYIIDDSQLITNTPLDTEFLKFGSGMLLNDVFEYIQLKKHSEAKIVFIGDKNKLIYGSYEENALNPTNLQRCLQKEEIYTEIAEISLPANEDYTEIVDVCNGIAKSIQAGRFNHLKIRSTAQTLFCQDEQKKVLLEYIYENPTTSKFLVYTNEQAAKVNLWVKRNIIRNGWELNKKDYVIFNAATKAYTQDQMESINHLNEEGIAGLEPRKIDNGLFGEVTYVNYEQAIESVEEIKDGKVTLKFIPCHIKLNDSSVIETFIFDNYLYAEGNELSGNEVVAYQTMLSRYEKQLLAEEPFEYSPEYSHMIKSDDFVELQDGKRTLYRMRDNHRKLTKYEKTYRQRVLKKRNRPGSMYFKLFHAARVKYGWTITVNKAMAYSFENVFFNVDKGINYGKTNKEYFKWLYTGIASAANEIHFINWQPITPYLKTEFKILEPKPIPTNKTVLFQLSNADNPGQELEQFLEKHLAKLGVVIKSKSSSYQEQVTLQMNNRLLELVFTYNGQGEIKLPRYRTGSMEDFDQVIDELKKKSLNLMEEVGDFKPYLEELAAIAEAQNIQMKVQDYREWDVKLNFKKQQVELNVQLYYNSLYLISGFNYINGDPGLFKELKHTIEAFYGLKKELTIS